MEDKEQEKSHVEPIVKNLDNVEEELGGYVEEYFEKSNEYTDFILKSSRLSILDKKWTIQIAQFNDELCILEDKILKIYRLFMNENVVWEQGGIQGSIASAERFQEDIDDLISARMERNDDMRKLSLWLMQNNISLWRDFDKYLKSLNVKYDFEEARNEIERKPSISYHNIKDRKDDLDYWTDQR